MYLQLSISRTAASPASPKKAATIANRTALAMADISATSLRGPGGGCTSPADFYRPLEAVILAGGAVRLTLDLPSGVISWRRVHDAENLGSPSAFTASLIMDAESDAFRADAAITGARGIAAMVLSFMADRSWSGAWAVHSTAGDAVIPLAGSQADAFPAALRLMNSARSVHAWVREGNALHVIARMPGEEIFPEPVTIG